MKKIYFFTSVFYSIFSFGQISLISSGVAYLQDFDIMGNTKVFPAGWSAIRASGSGTVGQSLTLAVTDGNSSSGGVYNVGTAGNPDRALGTMASGSTIPALGAQFINNTGSDITSITISFTEEQWKTGSNTAIEVVAFSYSTDADRLDSGSWTPVTDLDMVEILTSDNNNTPVDGNLAVNRVNKSHTISGLNIPNGGNLFIKWVDKNEPGSDGLYAVDDFSLTPNTSILGVTDVRKSKIKFIKNTFVQHEIIFETEVKMVKIYNHLGQIIKESALPINMKFNISELPKGNYIVTAIVNNTQVFQKIVKD
ncbi:T9SS type A sorting domain-containing protein [Chryseobacterium sp.]|uniref:T9SS type A sorting domain-containing protein n=1 Tax=Chryseobacterium sp. TaxID=1871047 RepID=UPI0025BDE3CF|nr:T9SS type A sorting domain-containing protein [Chryseobacterium sp.]